MESGHNPLHKIQITFDKGRLPQGENILYPDDFASRPVLRALLSAEDRRLYALLRAYGLSSVEAWSAAFAKRFHIHPDAVAKVAEVYESTSIAKSELLEVLDTTDPHTLKIEWARQVQLMKVEAEDVAIHLRQAYPVDHRAIAQSQCAQPHDHAALAAILDKRSREIEAKEAAECRDGPEIDWSRKFEGE
ncbi:hypothetical protein [Pandoraea anhela]|uniref:Uncharacterized protein n=1 Tax=Pandoraea anhela TaxID=2508295 RepID=A0A5E4TJ78_9BURK|nr:hypothetical protein [Pandoraea anhela]VVD87322.1 hypothetical protein PAN31108_01444 [Pandoraea anhela]